MRVQLLHAAPSLRSPTKYNRPSPTPFALSNIHCLCGTNHDFDRPSGTGPFCIDTQALRACICLASRPQLNTRLVLTWPASKNPEHEFEFEYDIRTDCEEKALLDRAEISLGSNLSIGRRLAIVLVVVVLRPRSGIAWFARWKEDERRKQALGVSLLPPEKRPRTKDEDEDDWEMTLNTYSCLATIGLSLRDKSHSPIEAPHNYLSADGRNPGLSPPVPFGRRFPDVNLCKCP